MKTTKPVRVAEEFIKNHEFQMDSTYIFCSKTEFYSFCLDFSGAIHENVQQIFKK